MPNLLSLPRELRDDIYARVLTPEEPAEAPRARAGPRIAIPRPLPSAAEAGTESAPDSGPESDSASTSGSADTPAADGAVDSDPLRSATPPSSLPSAPTTPIVDDGTGPEPGYYRHEDAVRYPPRGPASTASALLRASRQMRAELRELFTRHRQRPRSAAATASPTGSSTASNTPTITADSHGLTYRIRLDRRADLDRLYPTWSAIPWRTRGRIDTLDVTLRARADRTSTICSANADDTAQEVADAEVRARGYAPPSAELPGLLRRFLERGVDFLAKREGGLDTPSGPGSGSGKEALSIGLVLCTLVLPDEGTVNQWYPAHPSFLNDVEAAVNGWMRGDRWHLGRSPPERALEDGRFFFLAARVERLVVAFKDGRREWRSGDVVAERRRIIAAREREEARQQESSAV